MLRHRWRMLFSLVLLAFAVNGCGSKKNVTINGTVLKGGKPMIVSERTYVTLSFIPEGKDEEDRTSYNATFDQKSGTYTVDLPPGSYRTKLIIAPPPSGSGGKPSGKPSAPQKPVNSTKSYDLTSSQELDIEVPGP